MIICALGMLHDAGDTTYHEDSPNHLRDVPRKIVPFLRYVAQPRFLDEVQCWMRERNVPDRMLHVLISDGYVMTIDDSSMESILDALNTVCFVPLGVRRYERFEDSEMVWYGAHFADADAVGVRRTSMDCIDAQYVRAGLIDTATRTGLSMREKAHLVVDIDALIEARLGYLMKA